ALEAHEREVRRLHPWRVVRADVEQAEREAPRASRQPTPALDRHDAGAVETDAAAVEQDWRGAPTVAGCTARAAEGKDALILQEELALLGKEQAEAGEVDLLLVGFDLREVGVVREIGGEILRHRVLRVAAEVGTVVRLQRRGGRQAA